MATWPCFFDCAFLGGVEEILEEWLLCWGGIYFFCLEKILYHGPVDIVGKNFKNDLKYDDRMVFIVSEMKQYILSKEMIREVEYGGEFQLGKRKTRRPFCRKEALHVVLCTDFSRLPMHRKMIEGVLVSLSRRFGVAVYDKAINTNHLHLLIRATSKASLTSFLRVLPGILAMRITGAKKGHALPTRFWVNRAWSRIVSFGREFKKVKKYILQNALEAAGLIPYTPRKQKTYRSSA